MNDKDKTKKQLIRELTELRKRTEKLEKAELERKWSEAASRQLADIFQYTHIGLTVGTFRGVFETMNPAYAEMHGYATEELIGKPIAVVYAPEVCHELPEILRQVNEKGYLAYETLHIRKNGSIFPVQVEAYGVKDDEGNVLYQIATVQDITERRRAEGALQASEKKFRDLLGTIQLAAVMLDCDGNITFCNDYLLDLTGWTRDEVLNRSWFDLFLPEDERHAARSVFQSTIAEGRNPAHYENSIRSRNGLLRTIVWDNASLRSPEGTVIGTASIGVDVTEHRATEEHLRQSQKIEAIGLLAGGVAHDFNNILTSIIGYGSLLGSRIPATDPLHLYVSQILDSADRAANLTHSLLAFSRKQVIDPRPVDINDIVVGIKQMLGRVISEDIEFNIHTAVHGLIVKADKSQIEQVLLNLATNARDAMPRGGRLTVTTEEVSVDEHFIRMHHYGEPGRYAVISVADTGEGMDQKTKEHIFDPFFTTKEVGKGTGLGLAMAYGTIKQHNGFINVSSEPGKGTTFRIYLPLAEAGLQVAEQKPPSPLSSGNETILLVEDDFAVRKITKTLLEELGYTVIEAVDGEHAVRLFRENKDSVKLVVSDIIMPKQSGGDVKKELKKIVPEVKVLFISGYAADFLAQKGITDGGVNFISKPLRPDTLSRKLREILDK